LEKFELANTAQAKKRARQSEKRRQSNTGQRSLLRTRIKNVIKAIESGDKSSAEAAYRLAMPVIDKMAGTKIIHGNKAARHKSRLHARIKNM
jgi:small subunit ribosomal protein S20